MSRYTLTASARVDLREIWDHIARDNPDAADRLLDRIYDRFRLLSGSPLLGELYDDFEGRIRFSTVGRYVIFYEPIGSGVRVNRVLHSARDLPAILGFPTDE